MYKSNIKNFVAKLPAPNEPKHIDIVLEGGGFNGTYEYGVLLLVEELEKQKHIVVDRISGASIGSILGYLYLTKQLDQFPNKFMQTCESFKREACLQSIKTDIKNTILSMDDESFSLISQNKLYLTYYNITDKKQITRFSYDTKEELIDCITRSCYVPFLFDHNVVLNNKDGFFIDGGQPFIFENRGAREKSILYVCINQIGKLKYMFTLQDEDPYNNRVLEGLLDSYQFFQYNKRTAICSYVNEWSVYDFIMIRGKESIIMAFVYIIYLIHKINQRIHPYIKDTAVYHLIASMMKTIFKDLMLLYCF